MGYKIQAKWADDCQGKKDYDGEIVSISTRYWGSRDYSPIGGNVTKPSANSSILLRHNEDDYTTLIEKEFEGETFEEVKVQVEEWAQVQMDNMVVLLRRVFDFGTNESA